MTGKTLKDRTVMISGASRGIGRSVAFELAGEGANISFNFLRSDDAARRLEEELGAMGVKAKSFRADIADYDAVKSWVNDTMDFFGGVDVVINNAGVIKDKALALMDPADWHDVIHTNLDGTFHLTRAAILHFIKKKSGVIINISSVSGVVGLPRQTNYAASKAGIIGFTRALAKEVAAYGVRVNAVAPGFIETDMLQGLKTEYMEEVLKGIPLKRLGRPEEVARAVKFLVSDRSGYVTGQTIIIDGGLSIA